MSETEERIAVLEAALRSAEERESAYKAEIQTLRKTSSRALESDQVTSLQLEVQALEEQLSELRSGSSMSHEELELSRIEDEKKEVEGMKQDMEALQAMVVAQTANLTIQSQAKAEVNQLQQELEEQKSMLEKAEQRCKLATIEKEKTTSQLQDALSSLQDERRKNSRLEHQLGLKQGEESKLNHQGSYVTIQSVPPAPLNRAPSGNSFLAIQHVSQIAKLETENRRLKGQLQKLKKAKKDACNDDQVKELKSNLAKACADIARLTVEVDQARNAEGDKNLDYRSYQAEIQKVQDQLKGQTDQNTKLKKMLDETDKRLQAALKVMRAMKEQACVEVVVKKETLHTREKRSGQFVPVDRHEESSKVTWFTDEKVKVIKTGPWLPAEDRVLLQAQLQHGNDWIEMAKLLPGRTDEAIRNRYTELVSVLMPKGFGDSQENLETEETHGKPNGKGNDWSTPLDENTYETPRMQRPSRPYEFADPMASHRPSDAYERPFGNGLPKGMSVQDYEIADSVSASKKTSVRDKYDMAVPMEDVESAGRVGQRQAEITPLSKANRQSSEMIVVI